MLSTATTHRIADELLEQARRSPFGITDPSGAAVPRVYQSEHMARLPQGMQQQIVQRATDTPAARLFMLLAPLAVLGLLFVAMDLFVQALPFSLLVGWLVFAPLVLPQMLLPVLLRPAVGRIAARIRASWPVAAEWQVHARARSHAFSALPD